MGGEFASSFSESDYTSFGQSSEGKLSLSKDSLQHTTSARGGASEFERRWSTLEWHDYFWSLIFKIHDTTEKALFDLGDVAKKIENELESQRSLFLSNMVPQLNSEMKNFFLKELFEKWRQTIHPMEEKSRGGTSVPLTCETSTQTDVLESTIDFKRYTPQEKNWRGGATCTDPFSKKIFSGGITHPRDPPEKS